MFDTTLRPGLLARPADLPLCRYPTARDTHRHGLRPLPEELPLADFEGAEPFRSRAHRVVPADELGPTRLLEMARVVGDSFALREPQCRYLQPPAAPPERLLGERHIDPLGTEAFGPWDRRSLMYWFVRLLLLTDPTAPRHAIPLRREVLEQSVAMVDASGRILGGAFNEPLPPPGAEAAMRSGDPFLDAVLSYVGPVMEMLLAQDREALGALSARFPEFAAAHGRGRVGHHFLVARGEAIDKSHAFELVAASAERFRDLGFAYMVVEASNTWTGAACEALGGVRVHFFPYRAARVVPASPVPLPGVASSPDGRLSGKDAGCAFYVLRLA